MEAADDFLPQGGKMDGQDGFQSGNKSMNVKVVPWEGNWEKFKRLFKAYGRMCGISEALKAGELMAAAETAKALKAGELITATETAKEEHDTRESCPWDSLGQSFKNKVEEQSPRLAAMLTLSLINTVGVQEAIVNDELENDEDGVKAWSLLVKQFELSTVDLKVDELFREWDAEVLHPSEHPCVLHARLVSIQRKMARLNENITDKNLIRRFISAIEKQPLDLSRFNY